MSRIRNKGTKPEVTLRKALFARGFRYRSFSFMDVSGMDIPAANMHILPKATRNSGLTKYQAIRNGMQRQNANLKNQDGR